LQHWANKLKQAGELTGLRSYFKLNKDIPYTDVWDFKMEPVIKGRHPCQKPLKLMHHIIETSCPPDGLVLDCFAGSGSTAIAANQLERRFIGCEMGQHEYEQAVARIKQETLN
jgi:adenine-specific DNA-methyltransferase